VAMSRGWHGWGAVGKCGEVEQRSPTERKHPRCGPQRKFYVEGMMQSKLGLPIALWAFALIAIAHTALTRLNWTNLNEIDWVSFVLLGSNLIAVSVVMVTKSQIARVVYSLGTLIVIALLAWAFAMAWATWGIFHSKHLLSIVVEFVALSLLWSKAASGVIRSSKADKRAGLFTLFASAAYSVVAIVVFFASSLPPGSVILALVAAIGVTFIVLQRRLEFESGLLT
jgi:hypothetical protein